MGRLLGFVAVIAGGCYSAPSPECGFICGTGGACPDGYSCSNADHRCHREGTSTTCEELADAPVVDAAPFPMIVSTSPGSAQQDVDTSALVTVTFNVPVVNVTTDTFQVTIHDTPIPGSLLFPDAMTATFAADHFDVGTMITARLTHDITDISGRGILPYLWTFEIGPDTTPPIVSGSMPVDGATVVSPEISIQLLFSEDVVGVDALEVSTGGTPITGTWHYLNDGGFHIATFFPDVKPFPFDTAIDIAGGPPLADYAGNQLTPFMMQFTTGGDDMPPFVTSSIPTNNSVAVPTDTTITAIFDEPVLNVTLTTFLVDDGTVTGTLASSMGGQAWTFTPDAALLAMTQHTVSFTTDITDLVGNRMASDESIMFTTK